MAPKLKETANGLILKTDLGDLFLDFLNDKKNYLRPLPKGKNELIARALGLGKGIKYVVDATAGLGQDAITLARLGFNVLAIEENDIIYRLLQDALNRAIAESNDQSNNQISWLTKVQFEFGNSEHKLMEFKKQGRPIEAIYIDPMFPESKKTALPRKEMQIFRELISSAESGEAILKIALKTAQKRVVVKRPLKGPELLKGVSHSYLGSTVRYDLYLPQD